jgi:hypothetical protein
MRRPAGGSPTSFGDFGVLDSGGPDFSVWVVEVETRTGEVVRTGALHAQAIALLAIVRHSSHLVLLEAEFLPLGELLLPLFFKGRPMRLNIGRIGGCREGCGEGVIQRYFLTSRHEDGDWILVVRGLDGVRLGVAAEEGENGVVLEVTRVRDWGDGVLERRCGDGTGD